MRSKTKMIVGIALVLGVLSIAFLAAPIQAYVNGTSNGDRLQTQDQDRLRTRDCNCTCDCTPTQLRDRERANESAPNQTGNGTMNLVQHRYQYRHQCTEGIESLGQ